MISNESRSALTLKKLSESAAAIPARNTLNSSTAEAPMLPSPAAVKSANVGAVVVPS
jgi:hypothetical protein